jgi:hypothetical protein
MHVAGRIRCAPEALCASTFVVAMLAPDALAQGRQSTKPNVHDAAEAGRWSVAMALAALLGIPIVWSLLARGWFVFQGQKAEKKPPFRWGFWSVVGIDTRVSTSETMAIVWT